MIDCLISYQNSLRKQLWNKIEKLKRKDTLMFNYLNKPENKF